MPTEGYFLFCKKADGIYQAEQYFSLSLFTIFKAFCIPEKIVLPPNGFSFSPYMIYIISKQYISFSRHESNPSQHEHSACTQLPPRLFPTSGESASVHFGRIHIASYRNVKMDLTELNPYIILRTRHAQCIISRLRTSRREVGFCLSTQKGTM
jgi:hypothetical protein